MKTIEAALSNVDGYLISISRDTIKGWYEIEIGLPAGWVFDENDKIGCEVLIDEDEGKLIKVSSKTEGIVIDDLIGFLEIIIATNLKIAEKEKQFTDSLEEKKRELEIWAKGFYKEMDDLKEISFKKVGEKFVDSLEVKSKRGRPKGSKNTTKEVVATEGLTQKEPMSTVTEETETLESRKE